MYFRKYSDIVLLINKINIHFPLSDKIIFISIPPIFLTLIAHLYLFHFFQLICKNPEVEWFLPTAENADFKKISFQIHFIRKD